MASAGMLLAVAGCPGDDAPPPEDPLPVRISHVEGWTRVTDAAADVFGADRPGEIVCDEENGFGEDDFLPSPSFEVNTGFCNWFTGAQASLEPITAGSTVSVTVWHEPLQAPMPAEGYVALAIDGVVVWDATVPIPAAPDFAPADLLEGEVVIDADLPAGTQMQFHVHNHGDNSWNLVELTATASADAT